MTDVNNNKIVNKIICSDVGESYKEPTKPKVVILLPHS